MQIEKLTKADRIKAALGLIFFVVYAVGVQFEAFSVQVLNGLLAAIWLYFVGDYSIYWAKAPKPKTYIFKNFIGFLTVLIPPLAFLKALRTTVLIELLKHRILLSLYQRVTAEVITFITFVWFGAGFVIAQIERNAPNGNIKSVSTGWYWAISTMSTVGYGDHYPVTTTGRFISIILMFAGIIMIGTISAGLSTWFVENSDQLFEQMELAVEETERAVETLQEEVAELIYEKDKK